jgi:hypothetical protein
MARGDAKHMDRKGYHTLEIVGHNLALLWSQMTPPPPSFLRKVQLKIQNSEHNVIKHKEHHKKYRGKKEEDAPPLPLEVTICLGKTSPACHNIKVQTMSFESIFLVKIDCS